MKTFIKNCVAIAIFIVSVSFCCGQLNHPGRGMYVDKFFRTTVNASGQTIVNSSLSILTITAKENALFQYTKDNHITYLVFYDLHRVLGTSYQTALCSFVIKAKTSFCIKLIGSASACSGLFDDTGSTVLIAAATDLLIS